MESCNRIKDGNERLEVGEDEVRMTYRDNVEDLYNIYTKEQVAVNMCSFGGVQRGNHFGAETVRRKEVEMRVGKLRFGKVVVMIRLMEKR